MSKLNLRRKLVRFFCVPCLIFFASGCGQENPIAISLSPQTAALGTGQSMQFTAIGAPSGVSWSVFGYTSLAPGLATDFGTIDASGMYTAPSGAQSLTVIVTAISKRDPSKSGIATINVVAPGQVTATNNVQVAQYTISPAKSAKVSVEFGTDTTYGLSTWAQPTAQFGGPVSLYVAGMKANTLYHMRGVVQFADGTQFVDGDQTFTTGGLPATRVPAITTTVTPGTTPQSGLELLDLVSAGNSSILAPIVTDLAGNILWAYDSGLPSLRLEPVKLLPNGHFLMGFNGLQVDGANSVIQEVDLGGNLIWQMTAADLNGALAAATCAGCNITVVGTHHDFAPLPNGHLIVIASTQQVVSGVTVTGDAIIDLDQNHKPVWLWNEFEHLDVNRQPYLFPDWTHTNAVLYSPDDGNLIISIRHQNWLVKVDYANGSGSGDILWHLGYQGDFTLLDSTGAVNNDPTAWFYAQHGPSFVSTNTTGKFSLTLFDNGNDRGVSVVAGGTCGLTGLPACYSTVPILQLDETAKTATLSFHPATFDYSNFGGNAEILKNGGVEYDECAATPLPSNSASIYEVIQASTPQTVWQMKIAGQFAYRGMRIPSLYPGVQW